jgi:hypothetical protein
LNRLQPILPHLPKALDVRAFRVTREATWLAADPYTSHLAL